MDVVSFRRSVSLIVDASPTLGYQHCVVGVVSWRRLISLVDQVSHAMVYQYYQLDVL
jgi:hypothetical protein